MLSVLRFLGFVECPLPYGTAAPGNSRFTDGLLDDNKWTLRQQLAIFDDDDMAITFGTNVMYDETLRFPYGAAAPGKFL